MLGVQMGEMLTCAKGMVVVGVLLWFVAVPVLLSTWHKLRVIRFNL